MESPLEGMNVLEVAYYYPGPYCCKILSELGARVTKIEPPFGDPMRYRKHIYAGMNAGKRIIKLDLKKESEREIFYEIVKDADVIVEGFRKGVARKLGIDYKTLKKINKGIIYCSISGFGQESELTRPVHDINILSMAGICEIAGVHERQPKDPNIQLSDFSSAVIAVISILSAYIQKLTTGKGAYIDVNMYDSAMFSVPLHILNMAELNSHLPEFYSNPGYKIYKARDCYISLGILDEPKFWQTLCERLDLQEYRGMNFQERLNKFKDISDSIEKKLGELNKDEIEDLFGEDIPYGIVRSLEQAVKDSQIIRNAEFDGETVKTISFPAKFQMG